MQEVVKSFRLISKIEADKIEPNKISIKTKEYVKKNQSNNLGLSIQKRFSKDVFNTLNAVNQNSGKEIKRFKIIVNKSP